MSKFKIRHLTKYLYEGPVRDSANQIMLYPIKDQYQDVVGHSIKISGDPSVDMHVDYFGNVVGTFTHPHPHTELIIDSRLEVVTKSRPVEQDLSSVAEQWSAVKNFKSKPDFIDFLKQEQFDAIAGVREIVEAGLSKSETPLVLAKHLCTYVFENFEYKKGITTVESTLDDVWSLKSGVCQDFAQMLLAMLRMARIPARYVSGYICPSQSGMRGEGATHAWVDAHLPNIGWSGLDPTNNCVANDTHVRLAVGRNFQDCSPVKGTYRGTSNHTLEVAVSVSYEDGHTSQPTNEPDPEPMTSFSRNSYRRHQEMQQQQ